MHGRLGILGALAIAALLPSAATAESRDDELSRPAAGRRAAAVSALSGASEPPNRCLTPRVTASDHLGELPLALRGAVRTLRRPVLLAGELRRPIEELPATLRYATETPSFDRLGAGGADAEALIAGASEGIRLAAELLHGGFGFDRPYELDVALASLGPNVDGYTVAPRGRQDSATRIVLGSTLGADRESVRRAAVHQYAHAVAGPEISPEWSEAFATWATARVLGWEETALEDFSSRLHRLDLGLDHADLRLAAGSGIWFAFLERAYSSAAIVTTLEELRRGNATYEALAAGLSRGSGASLDIALGELLVWSLLTGDRDDGLHFPFAGLLDSPRFEHEALGLPALSIQDAPVSGLGGTLTRIVPETTRGGMRLRFEGEFGGAWRAELLLALTGGSLHRIPLELDADGRGELAVPLDRVREAVLVVRNVEPGYAPRRYSWTADHDRSYPYRLLELQAAPAGASEPQVLVQWDTRDERDLVGFNVMRSRTDRFGERRVNPVWVPALGDGTEVASYSFVDADVEPGVTYRYRIDAVTVDGLITRSHETEILVRRPIVRR